VAGRISQNILDDAANGLTAVLILLQYNLDHETRLYILPVFTVHV
jgi:hypothetical protein